MGTGCCSGSGRCETKLDLEPDELAELDLLVEDAEVGGTVVSLGLLSFLVENSALPLAIALACISFCLLW